MDRCIRWTIRRRTPKRRGSNLELLNLLLIAALLLLLRKLLWCFRWLWCYHHGKETPAPISFLPRRSGEIFEGHLPRTEDEEER